MEIPFKQSPNYSTSTQKKLGVVLHFTLGAYKGAVEWLCNSNRPNRTSAHYIIGRNEGEVIQIVKDTDVAWHAGNISNPTERFKKVALKNLDGTYVNPNKYLIGIELACGYDMNNNKIVDPAEYKITEWQYKCLAELMKKWNFSADYVLSHNDIASYKENANEVRTEILARLVGEEMVNVPVPKSKVEKVLAYLKTI